MIHDFLVIGGGISGASVGYELAAQGSVVLCETESSAGYHSTGRSAALFTRNFGGPVVQKINRVSESFFLTPPSEFCERPLLSPRGALTVAAPGAEDHLSGVLAQSESGHEIGSLSREKALGMAPFLRPERVAAAVYEAGVTDIDVAGLHHAYVSGLKRRGGEVHTDRAVTGLSRSAGVWRAETKTGDVTARVIVNAAGAWAGAVGAMAGASDIGLVPMRRSAILVDVPGDLLRTTTPAVDFAGTDAYLKPEAGKLMACIGDATPTEPGDARPDEMDIALNADLVARETILEVRRIAHSWAGLRSYVADKAPIVGFDPIAEGFLWLAGQGGYGIMMAPAIATMAASLCNGAAFPAPALNAGITAGMLSVDRLGSR